MNILTTPQFEVMDTVDDRLYSGVKLRMELVPPVPPPISADAAFRSNYKRLKKASKKVPKIIGVQDPALVEISQKSDNTLSAENALTVSLDTTTYPDRAIVEITNDRGFDVYLTALSIHGRRVMQYDGALVNDKLKRDDDIRRNGENKLEIANSYIVDGTQVDTIADFWYKYTQSKKHIYSVTIKGTAPWYEVGEWYTFVLGAADTVEYISATVECYSVQCERTAGGIGSTVCMFREVLVDWVKTTLYKARAVLGGSPKRRTSRSNHIVVASSTFDGPYDFRCDGINDHVEMQAAIDYVSNTFGGGVVELTDGTFVIAETLQMKTNISLKGSGKATIIATSSITSLTLPAPHTGCAFIAIDGATATDGVCVSDLSIDGEDQAGTTINGIWIYQEASETVVISNIRVQNIKSSDTATGIYCGRSLTPFAGLVIARECVVENIDSDNIAGGSVGIWGMVRCSNCSVNNVTSTGYVRGFLNCNKCQQNTVSNCTTKYLGSYADSGTSYPCADTADGGFNS